jgi:hypothetical protein
VGHDVTGAQHLFTQAAERFVADVEERSVAFARTR